MTYLRSHSKKETQARTLSLTSKPSPDTPPRAPRARSHGPPSHLSTLGAAACGYRAITGPLAGAATKPHNQLTHGLPVTL